MIAAVLAILLVTNLLNHVWAPTAHLVVSPLAALLLLGVARWSGLTWTELGLGRAELISGLRWGGIGAALITSAYAVGLAVPLARASAEPSPGARAAAFSALVEVPLGTVLLEELAFRGVLWAMVAVNHGPWIATAASSLIFGLWHVLPSLSTSAGVRVPEAFAGGLVGRTAWVALNVLATAAAGVLFCELRRRSGSLVAPILVHWALNGVGFGFRAVVGRPVTR